LFEANLFGRIRGILKEKEDATDFVSLNGFIIEEEDGPRILKRALSPKKRRGP
jgi:hypothetical protein